MRNPFVRRCAGGHGDTQPDPSGGHRLVLDKERIPSRIASVFFTVHVHGVWHSTSAAAGQDDGRDVLARYHLRRQLEHTLGDYSVLDLAAAQDAANVALTPSLRPAADLEITGTVRLKAANAMRRLAKQHLDRQQQAGLDHEEIHHRIILLHRVLADTDTRLVWWVDQHPDRLADLPEFLKGLEKLHPPRDLSHEGFRTEVIRFTDQLLADFHTPQQREVFLRALTQALHALGSSRLKDQAAQWLPATGSDNGSRPS